VLLEVLQLDHQWQHEADVRTRERVVARRAVRRASVNVDDADALVVRLVLLRLPDDVAEL
jgi:hypothetical protein